MKRGIMKHVTVAIAALLLIAGRALAQENSIDAMQVTQSSGGTIVKLTMKQAMANPPAAFSVATPPRIAFDFPSTGNGLGRTTQAINEGDLRSANVVQAGDRTRLVLNLSRMTTYETRIEDKSVLHFSRGTAADGGRAACGLAFCGVAYNHRAPNS